MTEQWKKEMQQKMAGYRESDIEVSWADIEKALAANGKQAKVVPLWTKRIAAAAVVLLIVGGGYWMMRQQRGETTETGVTSIIQKPQDAPAPISAPANPVVENIVTQVAQGVRHLYAANNATTEAPLVAETESATTVPADTIPEATTVPDKTDTRTHHEVTPHYQPTLYPSDLRKRASSLNRLTAKVYLSNTMASSSLYNASSYQLEVPGEKNDDYWKNIDGQEKSQFFGGVGDGNTSNSSSQQEDETNQSQNKEGDKIPDEESAYKIVQTSESVHHHQPIRFGFSFRYRFDERWGIESGLTYTRLSADITNTDDGQVTATEQRLNYIGVPLSASYLIWGNRYFNFYLSAGGLVEKMVKGSRTTQGETNSVSIHPLQVSVNGAAGAEFKFTEGLSLYAEPSLNYYFDNGSSIPTLYQEKPLNFNLNVGIRFNLK